MNASLKRCLLLIVGPLLVSALCWGQANQDLLSSEAGRARVFDALVEVFKENYWQADYQDWNAWAERYRSAALAAGSRPAFDRVVRRMIHALGDGHSSWVGLVSYVASEQHLPELTPQLGIGVSYSYLPGVGMLIERVFPQTPAARAGLHRGDVVVRINSEDVQHLQGLFELNHLFDRAVTTREVKLGIRRELEHYNISLTPEWISLEHVKTLPQAEMLDDNTGYLYIPTFNTPQVAEEVHHLITELKSQGAESLVLDLRGNLGGRLGELGLVLGAFIEGPWAQAVSRGDIALRGSYHIDEGMAFNTLASPDADFSSRQVLETTPVHFEGPLVVLVDRFNSSAGEIAALVLQSMGRAKVVGEPTGGNVEVVRGFDLPDGSLVMVAVANVQSISGEAFDRGVMPDVYASDDLQELARGFDAPVSEALRILNELPFTPGKFFSHPADSPTVPRALGAD